jgi:hypothetical protein
VRSKQALSLKSTLFLDKVCANQNKDKYGNNNMKDHNKEEAKIPTLYAL